MLLFFFTEFQAYCVSFGFVNKVRISLSGETFVRNYVGCVLCLLA